MFSRSPVLQSVLASTTTFANRHKPTVLFYMLYRKNWRRGQDRGTDRHKYEDTHRETQTLEDRIEREGGREIIAIII